MNLTQTKNIFFKILIGCLAAAATIAVITVLIGKFNEVTSKALFTILIVALHSLVSISFIQNNEKQSTFESLNIFTNATFAIIICSFATSLIGLWGIISPNIVGRLYGLYFVLLFSTLHGEILAKTMGKQTNIDTIVKINFIFMAIVVLMFIPIIFLTKSTVLSGFYYRSMAAAGIIDGTLTLCAVILHNLYVQKHPKMVDPLFSIQQVPVPGGMPGQMMQIQVPQDLKPKRHINGFVIVLLGFVALQVIGSVIVGILGVVRR